MSAQLRVVRQTGVCEFCLRTLPREDLRPDPSAEVAVLVCRDESACVSEFERQESLGWKDHDVIARPA